jgi:hypothetical protein
MYINIISGKNNKKFLVIFFHLILIKMLFNWLCNNSNLWTFVFYSWNWLLIVGVSISLYQIQVVNLPHFQFVTTCNYGSCPIPFHTLCYSCFIAHQNKKIIFGGFDLKHSKNPSHCLLISCSESTRKNTITNWRFFKEKHKNLLITFSSFFIK